MLLTHAQAALLLLGAAASASWTCAPEQSDALRHLLVPVEVQEVGEQLELVHGEGQLLQGSGDSRELGHAVNHLGHRAAADCFQVSTPLVELGKSCSRRECIAGGNQNK
jgi:hypothetical protein